MLVINLQLNEDDLEMGSLLLSNFPVSDLSTMDKESVEALFGYKYYLNAVYDTISIENRNYIITKKTKKAVQLLYVGGNTNE